MTARPDVAMLLRCIVGTLPQFAYRFSDEAALHAGIARVLADAGIGFQHEFVANPQDRFDILCDGGIVIEAKVHGSIGPALAQCARYATNDDVTAVVLATSRHWGRAAQSIQESTLHGKPFRIVQLRGQSF